MTIARAGRACCALASVVASTLLMAQVEQTAPAAAAEPPTPAVAPETEAAADAAPDAGPASPEKAEPALRAGESVWTRGALRLRLRPGYEPVRKEFKRTTPVVLLESSPVRGTDWWRVRTRSGVEGWTPASTLSPVRPVSPPSIADTLPPMLGDRSAEISELRARILSDPGASISACKALYLSGITDEALFDDIAARLVQELARSGEVSSGVWKQMLAGVGAGLIGGPALAAAATSAMGGTAPDRRNWAQNAAWLTKALSYSGYSKYRPMLEQAAELDSLGSGRIDRHAEAALQDLEKFAAWNRIINDSRNHTADRAPAATRIVNMIRSGEREVLRHGLQRTAALADASLYDEVEAELLKSHKTDFGDDDDREDAVALMAKALGRSGDAKYRATLTTVARDAASGKVRDTAEGALEQLDEQTAAR